MNNDDDKKTVSGHPVSKDGAQQDTTADNQGVINRVGDTFVDHSDIVQFDTDENVLNADYDKPINLLSPLANVLRGNMEHSIKSFLSRPYEFLNFTFTTSQTRNQELATIFLYSSVLANNYYKQKLKGFIGFRARSHVRLQVNANRFQQGRLILTYNPSAVVSSAHDNASASLVSRTQLPRVSLDVNSQTEASMTMPYVSDQPFYRADGTGQGYAGHFGVSIYSPLKSIGSIPVDCTLWIHFTDVELYWPSVLTPQSGSRVRAPINRELVGENKPISSGLRTISNVTATLSKIPIISTYLNPVSWISGVLSDAAKIAGFCKPKSCAKSVFALQQTPNWANVTGLDYSENVGAFEDNQVSYLPGVSPTSEDQMSLNYALSVPTWWFQQTWTTTQTPNTIITSNTLNPRSMYESLVGGFIQPTPLCYFSHLFGVWRGTIKVRVIVVKTEFHTGRLRFSFDPSGTVPVNSDDYAYQITQILDMRSASEWIIDIPYINTTVYTMSDISTPTPTGTFYISVLNALACPDTVTQSVEINIEVMAGTDFEFAMPNIPKSRNPKVLIETIPTNPSTFPDLSYCCSAPGGTVVAQGIVDEEHVQVVRGDHPIANVQPFKPTLVPAEACIGERITSLKQLALKPSFISSAFLLGRNVNTDAPRGSGYHNSTDSSYYIAGENASFYDWVRYCYGFYRGGVRVKVQSQDSNPMTVNFRSHLTKYKVPPSFGASGLKIITFTYGDALYTANNNDPLIDNNYSSQMASGKGAGQSTMEYSIPHYHYNPVRRNPLTDGFAGDGVSVSNDRYLYFWTPQQQPFTGTSKGATSVVSISGADDFQCGFFIGCPPINTINYLSKLTLDLANDNRAGTTIFKTNT